MRDLRIPVAYLSLVLCPTLLAVPSTAPARDADAIIAEMQPLPDRDDTRINDPAYLKAYEAEFRERCLKNAALQLELYQRFPKHPKAMWWLRVRWMNLRNYADHDALVKEIRDFIDQHAGSRDAIDATEILITTLEYYRSTHADDGAADPKADPALMAEIEDFIRLSPHDERGADFLFGFAQSVKDADRRHDLYRRIIVDYPGSDSAIYAGGKLRQIQQIGMPFKLGFREVHSNGWIHTNDLKGKVIVINFWATWCPPCRGEIPHLKELYTKYKPQGLEIIGVSLDGPREETDLDKLKKYLQENQITWLQYYQGDGFASAFSRSWGINAIPTMFVIDAEGNLLSTSARFDLDKLIPKLLSRRQ
jgi:thiol-disulfide isomerase/thioredoxin